MSPQVIVVVPTYDEAGNVEPLTTALLATGVVDSVLIVDDSSPDGTGDRAEELAAVDPRIQVLHRPEKAGLGPAYGAGFAQALAEMPQVVVQMDADFSHDPADVPRLVAAVREGADVAIGSRYVPGGRVGEWPWYRRALSRYGNVYAGLMLGTAVRDMTSGFRAFRAEALTRLDAASCRAFGYGFQVEMAWRAERLGLRVVEVPIVFHDRSWGESKMNFGIAVEAMGLVTRWGLARRRGRLPSLPTDPTPPRGHP